MSVRHLVRRPARSAHRRHPVAGRSPEDARPFRPTLLRAALWAGLAVPAGGVFAQALPAPTASAPTTPAATTVPSSAAAPVAPPVTLQRVEVNARPAGRDAALDERRQASASRIIVPREELERHGDQTLAESLKRLPGVTVDGAPGRGGGPRLRGMGGGYTQILIDGQRMPPGFSLDAISPEQVERVEILRAPTAEFGARAIAGTINIVLRDGARRKTRQAVVGGGVDGERPQFNLNLEDTGQDEALDHTVAVSAFRRGSENRSRTDTAHDAADGTPTLRQQRSDRSQRTSEGLFANARFSWKGEQAGDKLELQPFLHASRSHRRGSATLDQDVPVPDAADADTWPAYTDAQWDTRSSWAMARLQGNAQTTLGDGSRLTTRFGLTQGRSDSRTVRDESGGLGDAHKTSRSEAEDRNLEWSGKHAVLIGDGHSLASGWELQFNRREDLATSTVDGAADTSDPDAGATFVARTQRLAVYAQDEWTLRPGLSVYLGARWEGIRTRGDTTDGAVDHRSAVLTPLAHLLWRLPGADGKPGRDQIRASLTRSYRSPDTGQLIGRRSVNSMYPVGDGSGTNTADRPDRQGNPTLRPELAWGLEAGWEHYPAAGGLLSLNGWVRRIDDVIRNVTRLRDVGYADVQRWVRAPENLGPATAWGLEAEARGSARTLLGEGGSEDLQLRTSAALMRSRIDGIPGPDNRLDGQAPWQLTVGADWTLRGTAWTVGGSLAHTPGFTTAGVDGLSTWQGDKRALDLYAAWRRGTDLTVRVSLANALARDWITGTRRVFDDGRVQTTTERDDTWRVLTARAEWRF
ncbi:MAG: hypothetical protein RL223_77 [Pseudomonadota bacterium]